MASSIDGIPPVADQDANGNVTVHADFNDKLFVAGDKAGNGAAPSAGHDAKRKINVVARISSGRTAGAEEEALGMFVYNGPHPSQSGSQPQPLMEAALSPEAAVARSMTIQGQLKGAKQLGDAMVFFDTNGNRQTVQGLKQVGKATFYQAGTVWVQDGFDFKADAKKLIKIKPFSPAYFDLLKAVPDLAPVLALGDIIYLRHQGHQIVITDEGVEALDAAILTRIQKPA